MFFLAQLIIIAILSHLNLSFSLSTSPRHLQHEENNSIIFNIPCSDQIPQQILINSTELQNYNPNILINETSIQDTYNNQKILILNLIQNKETELCALNSLDINLKQTPYDYHFTLQLNSIFLQQTQEDGEVLETIINGKQVIIQPQLLVLQGLNSIYINSIIFQNLSKLILMESLQNLIFDTVSFQNSIVSQDTCLLHLKNIHQLSFLNSNISHVKILNGNYGAVLVQQVNNTIVKNSTFSENYSYRQGGSFYFLYCINLSIDATIFAKNKVQFGHGASIYVYNMQTVMVENTQFSENMSPFVAAGIYIDFTNHTEFHNNTFIGNKVYSSGTCIFVKASNYVLIQNSKFLYNFALDDCAVLYILSLENLHLKNNYFYKNKALLHGTVIFSRQNPYFHSENNKYIENVSSGKGSVALIQNIITPHLTYGLKMTNDIFMNNTCKEGGTLAIQSIPKIDPNFNLFQNLTFIGNIATDGQGGAIYLENIMQKLIIQDSFFQENKALISGGAITAQTIQNFELKNVKIIKNTVQNNGGGILIDTLSANITLISVHFLQNEAYNYAGALFIGSTTNVTLQSVIISQNKAQIITGGMIIKNSILVYLQDLLIQENISPTSTALKLDSSQNITLKNTQIQNNLAQNSIASLYILLSENINIENLTVFNNTANMDIAGIFLQFSDNFTIDNSKINNNYAENSVAAMQIQECNSVQISNSDISNNEANQDSAAIFSQSSSDFLITNTTFKNNTNNGKQSSSFSIKKSKNLQMISCIFENNTAKDIGTLSFQQSQNTTIKNSYFFNNTAQINAGVIYFQYSEIIEIENSEFIKNSSKKRAGAILMESSNIINVISCKFMNNSAKIGGSLTFINKNDQTILKNSKFSHNQAVLEGGSIYSENHKNFEIQNCNFENNLAINKGSALYFNVVGKLTIQDSIFEKHQTKLEGGAIYLLNTKELYIQTSKFIQNQATVQGGAIYSLNSEKISLKNTYFLDNKALNIKKNNNNINNNKETEKGGALYIQNSNSVTVKDSNFVNSTSKLYGGAIYLYEFQFSEISDTNFTNNRVFFDENIKTDQKSSDYLLSQGGSLYLEPGKKGQIPEISIKNSQFSDSQASSGAAILLNQSPDEEIKIDLKNLNFNNNLADLGSNIRFLGIKSQNQSNISLNNLKFIKNKDLLVQNSSNGLFFGYYYNEKLKDEQTSQFELCEQGKYLPQGEQQECLRCLKNGICPGGYKPVYPKNEYWRDSKDSYNFYHCKNNPEVCLGNDQCKEGHTGLLCENCDRKNNFSFQGSSKSCKKCDSNKAAIILQVIGVFLLIVLFLFNQIYGVIMRINKRLIQKVFSMIFNLNFEKVAQLSATTKILLVHFQILYTVLDKEFNEMDLDSLFSTFQNIGSPQTGFSKSLECLIPVEDNEDPEHIKKLGYYFAFYGLLILFGTMVFLICMEFVCFTIRKYITHSKQLFDYIQLTIICFFLFVQPPMVQNSLDYLKKRTVNNIDYCFANTFIQTDTSYYKNEIFPLNIILVFTVGIIFPIILAILLLKAKKSNTLRLISVQRKLGLLYLEYKPKNYYWELVIISLKMIIVMVTSQLDEQPYLKGILIVFLLGIYQFLCFRIWPYKTKILNQQALYSSTVMILSIGILTSTQKSENNQPNNTIQLILNIFTILINSLFILFSTYIMIGEFNVILRKKLIKFSFFQNKINSSIKSELLSKKRWKYLKKIIHSSLKTYKTQKTIKIFEEIFYSHSKTNQNTFQNTSPLKKFAKTQKSIDFQENSCSISEKNGENSIQIQDFSLSLINSPIRLFHQQQQEQQQQESPIQQKKPRKSSNTTFSTKNPVITSRKGSDFLLVPQKIPLEPQSQQNEILGQFLQKRNSSCQNINFIVQQDQDLSHNNLSTTNMLYENSIHLDLQSPNLSQARLKSKKIIPNYIGDSTQDIFFD